jgi:hypothetical protein
MEEPNPYEPPAELSVAPKLKKRNAKFRTILVYALISVPAAGFACFTTCLGGIGIGSQLVSYGDDYVGYSLLIGIMVGMLVFGYYLRLMLIEYRRP